VSQEKMAFVDCSESSDTVDTSLYGLGISPLTGYIRKVSLQPSELWLASTLSDSDDSVEVVSAEVNEASAADGFVHYIEAVSAEPLEYWLYPNCELEIPNTDETYSGESAAKSASCTDPESDVASLTACLHRILCKPDSFWLISCHIADGVNDTRMELNSPLCSAHHMPHIDAVFGNSQPEQGSVHDLWLPKSYTGDHLDKHEL